MKMKWLILIITLLILSVIGFVAVSFYYRIRPKLVALTFDDGPSATYTPQILEILEKYKVPATFFVVGDRVQAYPDVARMEYQKGFVVGNHSFDHSSLVGMSEIEIVQEIKKTDAEIRLAICGSDNPCNYKPAMFFRPPYGKADNKVKGVIWGLGYTEVLWNTYSYDNDVIDRGGSYKEIVRLIFLQIRKPKEVVLMHDAGRDHTKDIQALPEIIEGYRKLGYKFVTVKEIYN